MDKWIETSYLIIHAISLGIMALILLTTLAAILIIEIGIIEFLLGIHNPLTTHITQFVNYIRSLG